MINYYQKMLTHYSVMTSLFRINKLKIDKCCDFSRDIEYNIKAYILEILSRLVRAI